WRDWYHTPAGGLGPVSAFTNGAENLVWVFSDDASSSRDIADTVSHEAGHGFGLAHQSAYDANGNLLQEYNNNGGSFLTAPIMGNPSRAQYSRWWYGTTTSATTFQDDMAVLASTTNGFGYRADDHAGTAAAATWLDTAPSVSTTNGLIASATNSFDGG